MQIFSLREFLDKFFGKLPLRFVLTIPFLLQIFTTVGLVGYLSYINGQKSVDELANQLMREVSYRIDQNIKVYLNTPHQINQHKLDAVNLGLLTMDNLKPWENYLLQQVKSHQYISFTSMANKSGEYRTGERLSDGSFSLNVSGKSTNFNFYSYKTNLKGENIKLAKVVRNFDIRDHPSYYDAVKMGTSTWSSVYVSFLDPTLLISALQPVYDKNKQFQGVLITALSLEHIGKFLKTLNIGKSGQTFIIDRNGTLLATSTNERPFRSQNQTRFLIPSEKSSNLITKETSIFLSKHFGSLKKINYLQKLEQKLDVKINGNSYFVKVMPFKDGKDLDWLIVVVVPEKDFMEHINTNTHSTIILCIIALIITTIICILTARWIVKPILYLNQAAKKFTEGKWEQTLEVNSCYEIQELAMSFDIMVRQLQRYFAVLQAQNEELKNLNFAYAKFVPHHFLYFLKKKSIIDIQLGNQVTKEMAVMFSDIRSFSGISENMTPQENFDFVNAYLGRVSPKVRNNHGFIVKYLGDGMMAIFPKSPNDAIETGIAKQKALNEYNIERLKNGYQPIELGIGIHFGQMMVGIVGESGRMQGDAFSDNVNLASRLESITKFYGVSLIISKEFLDVLKEAEKYQIRFLDRVIVKGRKQPIDIYEVMDGYTETIQLLKWQTNSDFCQAIECYQNQEWLDAKRLFKQVLSINPEDKAALLYLRRLQKLMSKDVFKNWNGVWALTEK
jgi:class 3 adenylate cyclase/HAMP domain-containing protein